MTNLSKIIVLILGIVLMGMVACADSIDDQNNAFRVVIEELQNRVTVLEGAISGKSHLVYPQSWATGDGTVGDPWANSCIESAYTACPISGTIFLRAGYYQLAGQLTISKKINLIGEGINKTFILTADAKGIKVDTNGDYSTLRDFTIDGDAQTDVAGRYPLSTHYVDYATFKNIEIKNGGRTGFHIEETNNTLFQNLYSHDNHGHGLHPGTDDVARGKYNTYRDIYAYDNGSNGFDDRGSSVDSKAELYNLYDHLVCWGNGIYGIALAKMNGGSLVNSITNNNDHSGMYYHTVKNFTIENCFANSNYQRGIYLYNCENFNLSNIITKNNSTSDTAGDPGIHIFNCPSVKLSLCQSYDDRDSLLQDYGIKITGTTNYIEITNCKLTPNEKGAILNDAGAVIIQWPPDSEDGDLVQLITDFNALLVRIQTASEAINE